MCGIFGVYQIDGTPIEPAQVQQATTTLRHRGPDDEGYLLIDTQHDQLTLCGGCDTNPHLNLPSIETQHAARHTYHAALGFRRLAILDLSPAGHQPMSSVDGRYWIIFNGEVYNYLELRAELAGHGFTFHTGTDTEVILAAYQHWGVECLSHFNGMWAFAVWDHAERSLFIARDRFGIKPLHYTFDGRRFAFASEIKALVGQHGLPFTPKPRAIFDYLAAGRLPSPQQGHTFFDGVNALPPGHWLRVSQNGLTIQRYWILHVTRDAAPHTVPANVVDEYRSLFADSIRLRLRSDVPIGTCLSGGVDSSSIVCVVNRLMAKGGLSAGQIGQQQKTFSSVYDTASRYNERDHVEAVLRATGAEKNFTVPSYQRLREDIERLIWHQDEPFGSTSIFAQWCVMEAVHKRGVTVLLDGQGADETLAGYRPFAFLLGDNIRQGRVAHALREAHAIQSITGLSAARLLGRALAWQMPDGWLNALRQQRMERAIDQLGLNPEFAAPHLHEMRASPSEPRDLTGHLLDQVQETSLPHLLRYEDRNSMAFSIEARVPFLDYRLVEFSFNDAAALRIRNGWTKWVLRRAMDGLVPGDIIWRKDKVGFETPEDDWLREWMKSEPEFLGGNTPCRGYLNTSVIRRHVAQWTESKVARPSNLWLWINLEIWLRVWQSA